MTAADLAKLVKGAKQRADAMWWDGRCPAHDDRRASLTFADGDRGVIVKCHASCTVDAIAKALGLDVSQLFYANGNGNGHKSKAKAVAEYDYQDERGNLLYQVVRFEPKDFRPRLPDGSWTLNGVRRVVYRLPELAEAERVYLVEGEKDADRLVSLGLRATTTAGGAKAWRSEYAEQIAQAGVPLVVAVPDRDAAGYAYVAQATNDLRAHGVEVRTVNLPVASKGDISDWLDAGHSVEELESLADSATAATAGPDEVREGDDVTFRWHEHHVEIRVSSCHEGSEGLHAEIAVALADAELHWSRLNLASTPAREGLRKKLEDAVPDIPWRALLEHACRRAAFLVREGTPAVALEPRIHDLTERYALAPLQPRGQTALLYVHGGGGKSTTGVLASILTITGMTVAGLRPYVTGPVLYLDWESTQDEHETRLALLARGLNLDPGALRNKLFYRPMAGRLADDARRLRQDVARYRAVSVIVDSVVPAAGPEAEGSEAAVRLMSTLRSLGDGVSRLLLGHVSKGEAVQGGPTHPFGSVFYWNLSRSVWELRADDEDRDHLRVSFTHKKVNAGSKHPTFGLDYQFLDDRIIVDSLDLADRPSLTRSAALPERFLLALKTSPMTTKEMATTLSTSEPVAGAVGRRLHERKQVVKIPIVPAAEDGSRFKWVLA